MSKKVKILLSKNNQLEKQISLDSELVMTDIVVYLRGANISEYQQEVIRQDVLQMVIDGEQRGTEIKDIIGEDYQSFCDQIINEVPKLTKRQRCLYAVRDGCLYFGILIAIWAGFGVIEMLKNNSLYIPVTVGDIISICMCILAAIVIVGIITKKSFDETFSKGKQMHALFIGALLICITTAVLFTQRAFEVHVVILGAILLILAALYKIIDGRLEG